MAAVKVVADEQLGKGNVSERFQREYEILQQFRHPNIVRFLGVGRQRGIAYFAMEFVPGDTLDKVLEERGFLPWQEVVELGLQICDALHYAHQRGVVHRDLKSDNIMLLDTMTGDHAKVLDFGIAKINEPDGAVDTNLTAPNLVIGTPQYMSPEQCSQDSEIDARSDI